MQGGSTAARTVLDGSGLRIGIVRARFNETVTQALEQACRAALQDMGVTAQDIHTVTVPGALEVPLALQGMAESACFDALVALGCIIRGETYHFELVANESGAGVTRVGLDHHIPIANAILTVEDAQQAQARQVEKGRDAAVVAVEMARLLQSLALLPDGGDAGVDRAPSGTPRP
jgi:6,7-dimethyl-8-ribityllumazine synthase